MMKINNVTCKTKYEQALETANNTTPGWSCVSSTGEKTQISKKIIKRIDDTVCNVIPFKHTYISEHMKFPLISLDHLKPYFISAQTGAGKTEFIFRTIYPYLHNRGQKLLILVSRTPLKNKVKYDAIDAAGTRQRELLTTLGIECEHHFGDIDVYSYQDFAIGLTSYKHKQELQNSSYGAVIFDECQFFIADSDFNISSEFIFDYLCNYAISKEIPRIYMTGTPEYVFDIIYEKESSFLHRRYNFEMNLFLFERDYQYLSLMTFNPEEITDSILHCIDSSTNVKWIIFVDSKETGFELYENIVARKKTVLFLYSEVLHSENMDKDKTESINNLVDKENLSCDVLIATKCLDVGISIKNQNINIINLLHDQVDFLQSIGRKRVSGTENVNLLIPAYTKSHVNRWLKRAHSNYEELLSACHFYQTGIAGDCSELPYPIYIKNGKYNKNNFALIKLQNTIHELEELLDKIKTSDLPDTEVITRHFASWMPHCRFLNNYQQEDTENAELLEIINSYRTSLMDETSFRALCDKLKPFDPRSDQRGERSELNTQTVNILLKPMSLKIKRTKNKTGAFYQIVPKEDS